MQCSFFDNFLAGCGRFRIVVMKFRTPNLACRVTAQVLGLGWLNAEVLSSSPPPNTIFYPCSIASIGRYRSDTTIRVCAKTSVLLFTEKLYILGFFFLKTVFSLLYIFYWNRTPRARNTVPDASVTRIGGAAIGRANIEIKINI